MAKVEWPVIGIDLGTTFSCVAVWHNGRVEIIHNDVGKRTTPSVVAFTEYEHLVGNAADTQAKLNPQNTVFDSKRLIGRRFNDVNVQEDIKLWPFKVISGTDVNTEDKPMINVNYMGEEQNFAPEQISAMILAKMKSFAEDFLHCTVKNAVITVPAYFNNLQRRATKEAGAIAGLNVVAIINEPTAAALAYGLDKEIAYRNNDKKNVVVVDLGGGTFDVSYVTIEQREVKVKAVNGDTHLGGRNFENNMVVALLEEFKKKHQNDISENHKAVRKLRVESNAAKEFLSSAVHTSIDIDCLYESIDFSSKWSRSRFENLNKHLFQNCISIVEKCLEDAKMEKSDVDDIVLIGGSTRIPKFRELLQAFFEGKELCKSINPDEAVAYGAAVHAAVLSGVCSSKQSIVLTDVTPLCLSLKNLDDSVTCVIPKFTAIPVTKHRIRVTARDNQTTVRFKVYEGDKDMAEENNFLDEFRILDIPPAPKGQTKFDVCFEIDRNGILNVSAVELSTGLRKEITVMNYNKHLSKEEIKRMVDKAKMLKTSSDMAKALKME